MSNEFILNKQKDTEHFIFYCIDKDIKCLDDLSKSLEDNCNTVLNYLNFNLSKKIEVKVYPDLKTFHVEGRKSENDPDWLVGCGCYDHIMMVSPLDPGPTHNYEQMLEVAVHEFCHVIIKRINPEINKSARFLNEGFASFLAKQMDTKRKTLIRQLIDEDKIPTFIQLQQNFVEVKGYPLSYTLAEFLDSEYGMGIVQELIRNPQDSEKILGESLEAVWNKWFKYLKTNY